MKKTTILLLVLLLTMSTFAGTFAVRINGTTDYPASLQSTQDFQNRDQYLAANISLNANDVITVYDVENAIEFPIGVLDPYGSYSHFSVSSSGVTCNTTGCYDVYIKLKYNDDLIYIGPGANCSSTDPIDPDTIITYSTSVPSQCTDVMLQGFYWDSNQNKQYGNTKWTTLNSQISELTTYFDLIWLPPSAKSDGGVGYHPTQWSNQTSTWGTETQLNSLITNIHAGGSKVIADIVVNHRGGKSTWCDFYGDNFGTYGQYQLTAAHICGDDEVNSTTASGTCRGAATGANDTGEKYAAARDLDHTSSYVRDAIKAYLKWLKNVMQYDGWRYDVAKGFGASYFNEYNQAAQNYFSVGEYWDGNPNTLQGWINGASNNSLVFDFATKYTAFNQGIAANDYTKLQGCGLLGLGYSKYAVTFVDNHDTFERSNGSDFQAITSKEKIMHANAFILSMPGVPCIYYPHWYTYKEDLKPMIAARKAVGIHSESTVSNESVSSSKYEATITGKNGSLILKIGSGSSYNTTPVGYTVAASGTNYAIFIKTNSTPIPKLCIAPAGGTYIGGTTVTMSVLNGGDIYYTLDGSIPTTSSTLYTSPIAITQTSSGKVTLKAFATNAGGTTAIQTHEYITYIAPRTEPIVVKFYKPTAWTSVYLWAWDDAGTNLYGTTWPGKIITNEGNNWWSYTFDISINSANIIFNNGAATNTIQTDDVINVTESTCYTFTSNKEVPAISPNCSETAIKYITNEAQLTIYPNPATHVLYLNAQSPIEKIEIYSHIGSLLSIFDTHTSNETVNISGLSSGIYMIKATLTNGKTSISKFIKY